VALFANTTGSGNMASGAGALQNNTTGDSNGVLSLWRDSYSRLNWQRRAEDLFQRSGPKTMTPQGRKAYRLNVTESAEVLSDEVGRGTIDFPCPRATGTAILRFAVKKQIPINNAE
jgi:hypothetical protein